MISYIEFVKIVDQTYQQFNWRYGQTIMNVLHGVWPDKYSKLINTNMDCYYDDGLSCTVLDILHKEWPQE